MPGPVPPTMCAKCGGRMEFGIVADSRGMSAEKVLEWIRGLPKRSWIDSGFRAAPRDRIQVASLRCTRCGSLDLYAPDVNTCAKCEYDRTGISSDAPCPECGTMPPWASRGKGKV